jgi:hypothetical protein
MTPEMYAILFALGLHTYTVQVLQGLGYKVSGHKAAKKLTDNAWKAHLTNGRSYPETLVIGVDTARNRVCEHPALN